ncbi:hypothetical protein LMG24238_06719 [Paraburkholderia sediminicola]|uniref:Uncharacterized protein n=1 Tax=Paraburkholderia sediminicola TaxID=458836 RepID=A0A6J5CMU8_9BURK|nr:hypothetical protein [Paraburkholderia sediminicola]CAB3741118.1 hypothetical protein LMG24238_06719 [Paraburkholderia sediminicola]
MDILKIAQESGMQVMLNARIGREEYSSVTGSLQALERFAAALFSLLPNGTQTAGAQTEQEQR